MLAYCHMFLKLAVAGRVHSYTGLSTVDTPHPSIPCLGVPQAAAAPPRKTQLNAPTVSECIVGRSLH